MNSEPLWIRKSSLLAATLGGALLVIPALWFGPLLPFLDTICFAGINSYPARLSYGPFHYYVFQFTYILPLVLSRLCTDLGVGAERQVTLFYLLQAGLFYFAIGRILHRLVPNRALCGLAIVGGTLAFWDGLFLWGGPLAYSLAAALLALAVMLSVLEACDSRCNFSGWVTALALLAVVSHPFAVPMAAVLATLRLVLLPARRLKSVLLLGFLLLLSLVIKRDSPETADLSRLFSLDPRGIPPLLRALFTWDRATALQLFGFRSSALSLFFGVMAAVRCIGFAASPFALVLSRRSPGVRMLAALDVIVGALYLCSRENPAISMWPERILTFNTCITYASGIVAPLFLLGRLGVLEGLAGAPPARSLGRLWPVAALAVAAGLLRAETSVLRVGRGLQADFESARASFLALGYRNGTVSYGGYNSLYPLCRRSVPFLLFSDPAVIARDLVFVTEWHSQPRHPSRVADLELENAGYATTRTQYDVYFGIQGPRMVVVPTPHYLVDATLKVRFGAGIPASEPGAPLLTTGVPGDANFIYALRAGPDTVVLGWERWGNPQIRRSLPIRIDPGREYALRARLGFNSIHLDMDGFPVFVFHGPLSRLDNLEAGRNLLGASEGGSLPVFPGTFNVSQTREAGQPGARAAPRPARPETKLPSAPRS